MKIGWLSKRYFFLLCISVILIVVAVIAVFRFSRTKPTYLYVEIKMGQGLWWAQTAKPSIWFIKAL